MEEQAVLEETELEDTDLEDEEEEEEEEEKVAVLYAPLKNDDIHFEYDGNDQINNMDCDDGRVAFDNLAACHVRDCVHSANVQSMFKNIGRCFPQFRCVVSTSRGQ